MISQIFKSQIYSFLFFPSSPSSQGNSSLSRSLIEREIPCRLNSVQFDSMCLK